MISLRRVLLLAEMANILLECFDRHQQHRFGREGTEHNWEWHLSDQGSLSGIQGKGELSHGKDICATGTAFDCYVSLLTSLFGYNRF